MSETTTVTVTGMTCDHCVASVSEELEELDGVQQVDVVLETGRVTITSAEPIGRSAVAGAVREAGYSLA